MSETAVDTTCRHCGQHHGPHCPLVKAVEYYPDGSLKRVEYIDAQPIQTVPQPFAPNWPAPSWQHPNISSITWGAAADTTVWVLS